MFKDPLNFTLGYFQSFFAYVDKFLSLVCLLEESLLEKILEKNPDFFFFNCASAKVGLAISLNMKSLLSSSEFSDPCLLMGFVFKVLFFYKCYLESSVAPG